jgi:hypothetical protein
MMKPGVSARHAQIGEGFAIGFSHLLVSNDASSAAAAYPLLHAHWLAPQAGIPAESVPYHLFLHIIVSHFHFPPTLRSRAGCR